MKSIYFLLVAFVIASSCLAKDKIVNIEEYPGDSVYHPWHESESGNFYRVNARGVTTWFSLQPTGQTVTPIAVQYDYEFFEMMTRSLFTSLLDNGWDYCGSFEEYIPIDPTEEKLAKKEHAMPIMQSQEVLLFKRPK